MRLTEGTDRPADSDFVPRLRTMGFMAAGAGAVLKSILSNPPEKRLPVPDQPKGMESCHIFTSQPPKGRWERKNRTP